jgi:Type II secretion system (T2SS), protein E, N-terminal domain
VIDWQPVDGEVPSTSVPARESAPARVPLGQLLINAGFLTQAQLDDALYEGSRTGDRLGEVVVGRGLATEDDVARLLAEQWGLDYVERSSIWFDADALTRLSREDAIRLEALPTRVQDGRVVVAVAEPTEQRLAALRHVIGPETVMVVVPKSALDAGLRSDLLASRRPAPEPAELDELPPRLEAPAWGPPAAAPRAPAPVEELIPGEPPPARNEPPPISHPPPPRPEPRSEPQSEPPLASVAELPVLRQTDADADAVIALAHDARVAAERLAARAAALTAQVRQGEVYEARIAALERQLADRTQQLAQVREQLEAVLRALHS